MVRQLGEANVSCYMNTTAADTAAAAASCNGVRRCGEACLPESVSRTMSAVDNSQRQHLMRDE